GSSPVTHGIPDGFESPSPVKRITSAAHGDTMYPSSQQRSASGSLGSAISSTRRSLRLEQRVLADRIGVSAHSISRWENNRTAPPALGRARRAPRAGPLLGDGRDGAHGAGRAATPPHPARHPRREAEPGAPGARGETVEVALLPLSFAPGRASVGQHPAHRRG